MLIDSIGSIWMATASPMPGLLTSAGSVPAADATALFERRNVDLLARGGRRDLLLRASVRRSGARRRRARLLRPRRLRLRRLARSDANIGHDAAHIRGVARVVDDAVELRLAARRADDIDDALDRRDRVVD